MATVSALTLYFLQGAMGAFSKLVVPLNACSYNVNQDGAGLSDIIRVPYVNAETASNAPNTAFYTSGYATATDTIVGKPITLDQVLYKRWDLNDTEILRTSPAVLTKMGERVGARICADALSVVFNQVTASNFSAYAATSASAFNAQAAFVALKSQADTANWPDDRTIIANPTLMAYILGSTTLVNYAYGSPTPVQEGTLPKYFGFSTHCVTTLNTNSELLQGFACQPDGLLVGMAYHSPQDEIPYTAKQKIVDEKTGFVLGYRQFYDFTLAKTIRVLDVLEGTATGNPAAVIRIQTTPGSPA